MNKMLIRFMLVIWAAMISVQVDGQEISANKKAIIDSVEKHEADLIRISDEIWAYAEIALEEYKSSKALADYAEAQGFTVERGVAEMPTAFIASYGSGEPIIGVLGEFDALPGLSQKVQPTQSPLEEGAGGHGCGHNLFGAGSLGAAIAIKELIEQGKLEGTVRLYGTPAEEKYFGKLYFARAGLFDDLDVCLDWHPLPNTASDVQSYQALIDFIVEFYGQTAHAASDPWNGRSASDGLELFTTGLNYLREHVKPTVRIHYHIQNAGEVVNVVPDYSRVWTRIRDSRRDDMLKVYERVKKMVEGAAMMADVESKITLVSGLHEVIVNRTGGTALQKNLELLGPIQYTEEEIAFAKRIQAETGKPELGLASEIPPLEETQSEAKGGSTDTGDVSWLVPQIRLAVTSAPIDTPWHSWAVVACAGMSIGHKSLLFAAKAMGMTMVDLFEDPELRAEVKEEFRERMSGRVYKAILPEGPPPIPKREQ